MKSTTGLKLNFSDKGKVSFTKGKSTLPHRTEYIEQQLNKKDLTGLDKIFFEDPVPGYNNESTLEQAQKEGELMTRYIKICKEESVGTRGEGDNG